MKHTKLMIVFTITVLVICFTGCDWMTQHTITASAGPHGDIDPEGEVPVAHGESVTFDITPDYGWNILDVTVDGESVGAVSSYTFSNVTEDHEIHATFTDIINVSGNWSGPLTIEGETGYELEANLSQSGTYITGDAAILYSGVPLTDYDVDWTIDGTSIEGWLYGTSASVYDIEVTATVNAAGNEIDGDFYIPDSDASGTFSITKN